MKSTPCGELHILTNGVTHYGPTQFRVHVLRLRRGVADHGAVRGAVGPARTEAAERAGSGAADGGGGGERNVTDEARADAEFGPPRRSLRALKKLSRPAGPSRLRVVYL